MTVVYNHTTGLPAPAEDSLTAQLGRDPSVPQVFDFSNTDEPPEPAQVAPGLWRLPLPDKPIMVGHALDYHGNPGGSVLTDGVLLQPWTALPVQVCEGCDPEVLVSPGPEFTFLIANHQPGCPRYALLAARRTS